MAIVLSLFVVPSAAQLLSFISVWVWERSGLAASTLPILTCVLHLPSHSIQTYQTDLFALLLHFLE